MISSDDSYTTDYSKEEVEVVSDTHGNRIGGAIGSPQFDAEEEGLRESQVGGLNSVPVMRKPMLLMPSNEKMANKSLS